MPFMTASDAMGEAPEVTKSEAPNSRLSTVYQAVILRMAHPFFPAIARRIAIISR
jgi:hypothetical protein